MNVERIDRVFGRGRLRMVTGAQVEVFREAAAPGESRRYTKRFLATPDGDYGEWTEREWRILARLIGHGARCVPDVVQFDRDAHGPMLVQTYDAGATVDQWATLLPVERDGVVRPTVFADCAHWWSLAHHCLRAFAEIHALGLVHLDVKGDNVCIPVGPDGFDPLLRGARLFPVFDKLALIDFAFSLASGETLATPLPIGWQREYDYQSPRLLDALEAGRRGDLRPTERLDWRCDFYSLAAMLKRYLPDDRRVHDSALACGWTFARYDAAKRLVLAIREAHDGALPARLPHDALLATTRAELAAPDLAQSLSIGWRLAPDAAVAEAAVPATPVTPLTRVAPSIRLVVPPRDEPTMPAVLMTASPQRPAQAAATRPRWTVPLLVGGAALFAFAMVQLVSGVPSSWQERLRAFRAPAAAPAAPAPAVAGAADATTPTPEAAPVAPADPPEPVATSSMPARAATTATTTSAAPSEDTGAKEAAARTAKRAVTSKPAPASRPIAAATGKDRKIARAVPGRQPVKTGPTATRDPAPKPSPVPKAAPTPSTAPLPVRTPPPEPTRLASAAPAPVAAIPPSAPSKPAAEPPPAPAVTPSPAAAPAPATPPVAVVVQPSGGRTPAPITDHSRMREPQAAPREVAPVPSREAAAAERPRDPVAMARAVEPAPVERMREPAPIERMREPAAVAPATVDRAPDDYRDQAERALVTLVPKTAAQARIQIARVLRVAADAHHPAGEQAVLAVARLPQAGGDDLLLDRPRASREARRLHDEARYAYRARRDLRQALDLELRAFGADPLDPEIAGQLALLHLRIQPMQAERARLLALHALSLRSPQYPAGRADDWVTFAVASALTSRPIDATQGLYAAVAMAGHPERVCNAAVGALMIHGEPLREPVEALLMRLRAQGRDDSSRGCAAPPQRFVEWRAR